MPFITSCEVDFDADFNLSKEALSGIQPLPIPVVSIEEYNARYAEYKNGPYYEAVEEEPSEAMTSPEPIFDSVEYELRGGDGKYTRRETRFYPVNAVGKLFGTYVDNTTYTGSGAMIGRNLIMTAAHCVHSGKGGDVYRNIVFQPSYPDHGIWYRVQKVFVYSAWQTHGSFHADVAICITEPMNIVDFWGIQTALPEGTSKYGWTSYGYPAAPPFDGQAPYIDGGYETNKPWQSGGLKFEVKAIDSFDLTAGCSGGPWITNGRYNIGVYPIAGNDTQHQRPFHINGLNSFEFREFPGIIVSPAFSRSLLNFINTVLSQI